MRILHPTDFSEASSKALAVARQLKDLLKGELILLHAVEFPVRHKVYGDYWDELLEKTFEERRRELFNYIKEKLCELAPDAECRVDEGRPLKAILKHAEAADLIAMGTHGPEGLLERILGSVTERVIELATKPVVATKADAEVRPFKHLVVATGLAEPSLRALALAKKIADAAGARITLLHVVEPIPEPPIPVHMPDPKELLGQDYLEKLAKELAKLAEPYGAHPVVLEGDPAETLCKFVHENEGDAVFIGRSKQARFLGSVTREILEQAKRPVFVHP